MKTLSGYKTYVAAALTFAACVYYVWQGDLEKAFAAFVAALGLAGVRHAIGRQTPEPPDYPFPLALLFVFAAGMPTGVMGRALQARHYPAAATVADAARAHPTCCKDGNAAFRAAARSCFP